MDGREGMSLQGSAPYYLNRGGIGNLRPTHSVHGDVVGIQTPQAFKNLSNPNISIRTNLGISGGSSASTFHVDDSSPSFNPGTGTSSMMPSIGSQGGEIVAKKKRGRPRKYGPGESKMSLRLSSSAPLPAKNANVRKGRPPGSGWKQKLAPLGEWMNSSAGLAFTPHVIHVRPGEDIAAKIMAFAQQRPRALCIMSGGGSVSVVTLHQPTTSGDTVTYEGRFEILCLSGSYLVDESGGPRDRTGGISVSVCTPDGHMIGGAIGGELIASSPVQVVVCSFVYGNTKPKNKVESATTDDKMLLM